MRTRWPASLVVLALTTTALASVGSDDPRRSQMWWFDRIGVEAAWGTTRGEGITVAVLDTGIDGTHPDLQGRIGSGTDLVDGDDDPSDPHGHGTIVSGLVSAVANNGEGIAGVAPLSTIMPVRVLDGQGRGESGTVDEGIRWAVDNGADIVNLSLEVEEVEGGPDPRLIAPNAAIEYAWERGVIVVAATGNSGAGAAGYDDDSHVVLVGAVDKQDALAQFSDADRLDAVVAPGTEIVSTWCSPDGSGGCNPDERYGIGGGTSFAAPIVVGVLALLRGAGLDHVQAVDTLRATAVDLGDACADPTFGVGLVDAAAALAAAPDVLAGQPLADPCGTVSAGVQEPAEPVEEAPDAATGDDAPDDVASEPAPPSDTPSPTAAPGTDGDPASVPTAAPAPEPGDDPGALIAVASLLLLAAMLLLSREARLVRDARPTDLTPR